MLIPVSLIVNSGTATGAGDGCEGDSVGDDGVIRVAGVRTEYSGGLDSVLGVGGVEA